MNEEKFRSLYRDTMAGLHAPARLGAAPARPPRRRPTVLAAAVAVALAACSAVAAGGVTLRDLSLGESMAESAFTARVELPLTAPEDLPADIRRAAWQMKPEPEPEADSRFLISDGGMQFLELEQFRLTPDVGVEHGEDYTPGEALLTMDSWEAAGRALGWTLPTPAAADEMNVVTDTLTNTDPDGRYRALVRVQGDAAAGRVELVSAGTRWSGPRGSLSLTVYGLVGEGQTGTLDTTFRFWMGDATWQPEDYEMANGITATIAVPEAGFNPNGLWAYFVDDGKLCLVQWNCRTDGDGDRELADLKAVLDSFP